MSNSGKGLDIGTNMIVASEIGEDGNAIFKMQRDVFYKIIPKSKVNRNSIRMSLEKREFNFIEDSAGSFVVVGQPALETAIERNDTAKRPLRKGVISPREKDSLPILNMLIESLLGKGEGETLVYSVPAKPMDAAFDSVYHSEIMGMYLTEMGYSAQPINETFAIALSELIDEGLTGVCLSMGAGMCNVSVIHQGDPLVEFALTRAGDYIDQSVGQALDISPSLVQLEKESGTDLINPSTKIMNAVAVYYSSVIKYTLENIVFELNTRKKDLPVFRNSVPIVVAGGLVLAKGFIEKMQQAISIVDFPIKIKEIRRAKNPMTAVAHGALLAAQL